jgi:hypothetical protein
VAAGICMQHDIYYQPVENLEDMKKGIDLLISSDLSRPMVLEVHTNPDTDEQTYRAYYRLF